MPSTLRGSVLSESGCGEREAARCTHPSPEPPRLPRPMGLPQSHSLTSVGVLRAGEAAASIIYRAGAVRTVLLRASAAWIYSSQGPSDWSLHLELTSRKARGGSKRQSVGVSGPTGTPGFCLPDL